MKIKKNIINYILIVIPLILWVIHIFVIIPISKQMYGDDLFIFMLQFFFTSGFIMIIFEIISIIRIIITKNIILIISIILNLSWLYYIKVILYGTSVGNF